MARPVLVALEGGEGAGKSTQAARLAERLDAVLTLEPGGTAIGDAVRRLLLDPGGGPVGGVGPLRRVVARLPGLRAGGAPGGGAGPVGVRHGGPASRRGRRARRRSRRRCRAAGGGPRPPGGGGGGGP